LRSTKNARINNAIYSGIVPMHISGIYQEMEVFDNKFIGLLVEEDGDFCGELKNSVEQWRWYQLNHLYGYYTLLNVVPMHLLSRIPQFKV